MSARRPAGTPPAARPAPIRDPYNGPFWDALRAGVVRMPRCAGCGHVQFPMGPVCSECLGSDLAWTAVSGRGRVWGYAVYHHVFHPAFADEVPYNVAMIALDEGPLIASNVVGVENDAIQAGMRVAAVFDEVDAQTTLLRFRPLAEEEEG